MLINCLNIFFLHGYCRRRRRVANRRSMQSKSCNLAAAYLHSLLAFIEGLRPLLSASGLHWWPLASNRPSAFFEGYCLYCRPSASIDFLWHIYGLCHLNGLRPWRKSHLSLTFYHSGLATLVQKSRGEIFILSIYVALERVPSFYPRS